MNVRNRTRRLSSVLAGVLALSLVTACSPSTGPTPAEPTDEGPLETVRLGIVPVTPWLPVMVAAAEGFFDNHGLTVEITKVQQSPSAAIGQQFDLGQATGSDFSQAANSGIDLVLVSNIALLAESGAALVVREDSGITSVADLAGKRVGIASLGSVQAQSLLYLINEAGVDRNDVTLQEMPFPTMTDQLMANQVDAIAAVQPFVNAAVGAGGVRLFNPSWEAAVSAAPGADHYVEVFVASSRAWADSHPREIAAWRAALEDANAFILTNEAEARKILQEFTELPEAVASTVPLSEHSATPTTPAEIQVWIDVLIGSGELRADNRLDSSKLVVD